MNRARIFHRFLFSVAVSVTIGAIFFYFVPQQDITARLQQVEVQWHYLPLFFLAVLGNIYLRGETLALLVNSREHVSSGRWMAISSAHNLSTSLSGLVLGDAVLVWLLNRLDIHWQKSLFTTVVARMFELPSLILLMFLGLIGTPMLFPTQKLWIIFSGLAFAASFTLLFRLDWLVEQAPRGLWLGQKDKAAQLAQTYRHLASRCMQPLLLLSVGKIVSAFLFYVFAMRLFSIDQTIWEECLVFGIFTFASIFPIQGVLGLGTFEAYFSIGLIMLGWASDTALAVGFLVHMLFLASFALITAVCFFAIFLPYKKVRQD
jgi:hypothetical protein